MYCEAFNTNIYLNTILRINMLYIFMTIILWVGRSIDANSLLLLLHCAQKIPVYNHTICRDIIQFLFLYKDLNT